MKKVSPMRIAMVVVPVAALMVVARWSSMSAQALSVPPGFEISVFASRLDGVRALETGPDGMLYATRARQLLLRRTLCFLAFQRSPLLLRQFVTVGLCQG